MTGTWKYDVVIIGGLGHVGLPLGMVLADAGLQVGLVDVDAAKKKLVSQGVMPFIEYDAEPILKSVLGRTLHLCDGVSSVRDARIVLITLGTPVDEYLNPKLRPMLQLADSLAPYMHDGQCVVLRSTVFPGTTEALRDGFARHGLRVDVSYCPERIVQGYAIRELKSLPQIVGGFSPEAVTAAQELFERIGVETIVVSVEEAELCKLFANAWRYIQFAIANQFYMIAGRHGADFNRIHHAMTHHYDRAKSFPRAGLAAGPCLLKDTLQLAAFHGNNFQLGQAAMLINEGLPNFLVDELRARFDGGLHGKRVGILGMAFKADIDDNRDSLSYKLAKILQFRGATVTCSDEFISDPSFVSKEEIVSSCSVVIVAVPHSAYRRLRAPESTYVLDLWGAFGAEADAAAVPSRA